MRLEYQDYFDPEVEFEDDDDAMARRISASHERFQAAGFSDSESLALTQSGYSVLLGDLVVDRFYGGAMSRYDLRTRFPLADFRSSFGAFPNRMPFYRADSLASVYSHVEDLQSQSGRPLLYRGQTAHYKLTRPVPNPSFVQHDLGEISLLPSVWRRVLSKRMNVCHQFRDLSMLEWSAIIYGTFDVQAIVAREREAGLLAGFDPEELADTPDLEAVRHFHRHRQAFLAEYGFGTSALFCTLLQHYGLYSPVLDLTSDPEVALFFATQKYSRDAGRSRYDFAGTNSRNSIIYVFRQDPVETRQYERTSMLEALDPQRPRRQSCVVMPTNQFAMNLPGDFLVAAIRLDFDLCAPCALTCEQLFPSETQDHLLASFKRNLGPEERAALTDFY